MLMKTCIYAIFSLFVGAPFFGLTQLANGTNAPNFTLADINGNQHTLYDYLDAGKTVYLDFFACHCPFCWNYHSTQALSNLYDTYGPGTSADDVFVMAIEYDPNNTTDQFYGIGPNTQGDWVSGTNYPQFNPEGNARSQIIADYQVNYYPLIYAICPDRSITVIGTQPTETLYSHHSTCETLETVPPISERPFHFLQTASQLIISTDATAVAGATYVLIDVTGRIHLQVPVTEATQTISISDLKAGSYFVCLKRNNGQIAQQRFMKF